MSVDQPSAGPPRSDPFAPSAASQGAVLRVRHLATARSSASWFFFIAALTLVNTALFYFNSNRRFVIGTGVTDLANSVGADVITGVAGTIFAVIVNVVVIGGLVGLGWLGRKSITWAFLVGIVVYALDALLLVWITDWLSVVFHALAIFYLFRGFQASRQLVTATAAPSMPPATQSGIAPPITPR